MDLDLESLDTGLNIDDIELDDLSNIDLDIDFSNIDTDIDLEGIDIDADKILEEINKIDLSLDDISLENDV